MPTEVDPMIIAELEAKVRKLQRALDTIFGDASTLRYDPSDQTITIRTSHRAVTRSLLLTDAFPPVATGVMPLVTVPTQDRRWQ